MSNSKNSENENQDLLDLQSQRDALRANKFLSEDSEKMETLKSLDGLFFRLCEARGLALSKWGRLAS